MLSGEGGLDGLVLPSQFLHHYVVHESGCILS